MLEQRKLDTKTAEIAQSKAEKKRREEAEQEAERHEVEELEAKRTRRAEERHAREEELAWAVELLRPRFVARASDRAIRNLMMPRASSGYFATPWRSPFTKQECGPRDKSGEHKYSLNAFDASGSAARAQYRAGPTRHQVLTIKPEYVNELIGQFKLISTSMPSSSSPPPPKN
jgi:hypothetical protein